MRRYTDDELDWGEERKAQSLRNPNHLYHQMHTPLQHFPMGPIQPPTAPHMVPFLKTPHVFAQLVLDAFMRDCIFYSFAGRPRCANFGDVLLEKMRYQISILALTIT